MDDVDRVLHLKREVDGTGRSGVFRILLSSLLQCVHESRQGDPVVVESAEGGGAQLLRGVRRKQNPRRLRRSQTEVREAGSNTSFHTATALVYTCGFAANLAFRACRAGSVVGSASRPLRSASAMYFGAYFEASVGTRTPFSGVELPVGANLIHSLYRTVLPPIKMVYTWRSPSAPRAITSNTRVASAGFTVVEPCEAAANPSAMSSTLPLCGEASTHSNNNFKSIKINKKNHLALSKKQRAARFLPSSASALSRSDMAAADGVPGQSLSAACGHVQMMLRRIVSIAAPKSIIITFEVRVGGKSCATIQPLPMQVSYMQKATFVTF